MHLALAAGRPVQLRQETPCATIRHPLLVQCGLTMQTDETEQAESRPKSPVKGDYPRDPSLRGLAAVTFHSPPDDMPTPTTALDADSPRLSTWRRWKAAHPERDPNAPTLPSPLAHDRKR